jgi:hypothetical protein
MIDIIEVAKKFGAIAPDYRRMDGDNRVIFPAKGE